MNFQLILPSQAHMEHSQKLNTYSAQDKTRHVRELISHRLHSLTIMQLNEKLVTK